MDSMVATRTTGALVPTSWRAKSSCDLDTGAVGRRFSPLCPLEVRRFGPSSLAGACSSFGAHIKPVHQLNFQRRRLCSRAAQAGLSSDLKAFNETAGFPVHTVAQTANRTESRGVWESISQRGLSVALSLVLALSPLVAHPAYAASTSESAKGGVGGPQTEGISRLLDASKDSFEGRVSAESVVAKAGELKDSAARAIEGAKEKSGKVKSGARTLIEASKDSPGGKEEAQQVAQKAEDLKEKTSESVKATLQRAAKIREGAKQLAEAAQLDAPSTIPTKPPQEKSDQGKTTEAKAQKDGSQQKDNSQQTGGLLAKAQEGLKKLPGAISQGSKKAVKDEAPKGVESGIKGAVKEGVQSSVKEGVTGAVTGGVGGGVTGSLLGAAKGALSGATS